MKSFYTIILLIISQFFFGQNSSISGTVVDDSRGGSLPGVNVLIRALKLSTVTDSEGKFVFRNLANGSYEVELSYIGYQSKIISEVVTKSNDITYLNITLVEIKNELKEVVITRTKAKTESIKSLLVAQKNSITVSDGISAESIKRTPDRTTSDVLKRVSGVSIQDNKFVIIRGLNDRYNFATLNGGPLPSSEPDRKAFSFDIFPSNMLDNLVITKTASPDMPGEFAGGVISVNTKAVPDKNFQSLTFGSGYNTITTFKNQKDYKGSGTDWLGFDNGARALPASFPSKEAFNDGSNGLPALNGTAAATDIAKNVPFDFALQDKKFTPNSNFQYLIGHHFDFGDKVFGVVFSLSRLLTNVYNETTRNIWDQGDDASVLQRTSNESNYNQQVLTASLANFSLKLNQNHNFSFKNILSINSSDLVTERSSNETGTTLVFDSNVRWFTSDIIYSGQLNGEHYFPKVKIKANWTGFYSDISRSIPNLRRNLYATSDPASSDPNLSSPKAVIPETQGGPEQGGGIFFSENQESLQGGKLDLSRKFAIGKDLLNEVKIGALVQNRARDFSARQLNYSIINTPVGSFDESLLLLPDDKIFDPANIGTLASGKNGFTLRDVSYPTDAYLASSSLNAAYINVRQSI